MAELKFKPRGSGSRGQTLDHFTEPPFPTCPGSQGLSPSWQPCSPLQLLDLLGQDALFVPGLGLATLQLALFFPGKSRPQAGDRRQSYLWGYPLALLSAVEYEPQEASRGTAR